MSDDHCRICGDMIPGARFDADYDNECLLGARIVTECTRAMGQARFRAQVIKAQQQALESDDDT